MNLPPAWVLPMPGSKYRPCAADCKCKYCAYYRETGSKQCAFCKLVLDQSFTFWIVILPKGSVAHIDCWQAFFDLRHYLERAYWVELAAKKLGLTIEGFRSLPAYARQHELVYIAFEQDPEGKWQAQVVEELQRRKSVQSVSKGTSLPKPQ